MTFIKHLGDTELHVTKMREHAHLMFLEGVKAADPREAVKRALRLQSGKLRIVGDSHNNTGDHQDRGWDRVRVIAFGKAAITMTDGALDCIPDTFLVAPPIAVTSYENLLLRKEIDVRGAGHPIPDTAGLKAANLVAQQVASAGKTELVLALVSGGASALLPMPPASISLEDKTETTRLLLACGADIHKINTVRKHLSELKGGGLARRAIPATLRALILSDVVGDEPGTVGSGPTTGDLTTFAEAKAIFLQKGIWEQLPASVRTHLQRGCEGTIMETPRPGDAVFQNVRNTIVGSNSVSLDAVCKSAEAIGYEVEIYSGTLTGDARETATLLAKANQFPLERARAIVAGGETTVNVRGTGLGGRNQELALAFALAAERFPPNLEWAFLSGGTDGIDGPTDAAGGLVDRKTLARIHASGDSPKAMLDNNDAYHALQHAGDLLLTGATGTNVADLQILLIRPN